MFYCYSPITKALPVKLALKLLLTVLTAAAAAGLIWMTLPWLLIGFATQQLEVRGITDIEFGNLAIRLDGAELDTVRLSIDGMDIQLHDIKVAYDVAQLRYGALNSIEAGKLELLSTGQSAESSSLPDTAKIAGLLATPWFNYMPAERITLHDIILRSPDNDHTTQASLHLNRDADTINALVEIQSSESQAHRMTMTLSPDGELVVVLRGAEESTASPLILAAVPGREPGYLDASLSADLAAISKLFSSVVTDQQGRFSAQFSLVDEAAGGTGNTLFTSNGHLTNYSGHGLTAPRIDFSAAGHFEHAHNSFSLRFNDTSHITAASLEYADTQIGVTRVRLPAQINMSDDAVRIEGSKDVAAEFTDIRQDDISIGKATVSDLQFETQEKTEPPHLAGRFTLKLHDARKADVSLTTTPVSLAVSLPAAGTADPRITARTASVDIDTEYALVQLDNCLVKATLPDSSIAADIRCGLVPQNADLTAKLVYDTDDASGEADYRIENVTPDSDRPYFKTIVKNWIEPYDLVSGQITASGKYRWNRTKETLSMDLAVKDAGGFYSGVLFSGLNYNAKLGLLPDIVTRQPSSLSVDIIDVGIPVNNTRAMINLEPSRHGSLPLAIIDSLVMQLLDGNVSGQNIQFDFNTDYNEFDLQVSGLNLATTVAMQQIEGLQASGLMDGTIPVFLDEQGLRVINGELGARPPGGQIRYTPDGGTEEMQQAAPGTNIVFEILEDLTYHTLETKVNYAPDGNLILNLAIRGMSPRLDEKRPIHFNLNLEQNVLQLLKSLRIADDIDDVLDKNVQDYYKKHN
jgi:hypothetical protein